MSHLKLIITILVLSLFALAIQGCGGGETSNNNQNSPEQSSGNESGLTDFELEHGIGPVDEVVELGELDPDLAAQGNEVFEAKCTACHKTNERYIGPPLADVLDKRSPTYVMNMILNPDGMTKEHPVAKQLLQEYISPMTNQNLEREEARAIVEYFRTLESN